MRQGSIALQLKYQNTGPPLWGSHAYFIIFLENAIDHKSRRPPVRSVARTKSQRMREILLMVMRLGQTASHSPILEQLPKPSSSTLVTIRRVRLSRSGWPCGSLAYCVSLALVNSEAEEFGQAATHAPQPMQVADKKAASDSGLPIRMALASACGPVVTEV